MAKPVRWIAAAVACILFSGALIYTAVNGAAAATAQANVDYYHDFSALEYLLNSANAPIRAVASQAPAQSGQLSEISHLVGQAYRQLAYYHPGYLGILQPDRSGGPSVTDILNNLYAQMNSILGARAASFEQWFNNTYPVVSSTSWVQQHFPSPKTIIGGGGGGSWLVYATQYVNNPPPANYSGGDAVAALPDAYLKWANCNYYGDSACGGTIPSAWQPYYASAPYFVQVSKDNTTFYQLGVFESGPWNEDDNWWDVTNSPTYNDTPNGINYRRVYHAVLYEPNGTYDPSGPYNDTTNPPPAIPQGESEASYASTNTDSGGNVTPDGYNSNHGAWLRESGCGTSYVYYGECSSYGPINNQSSIDLGQQWVDSTWGWSNYQSGWIYVATNTLP